MFISCYNIYCQDISAVDKWTEYIDELIEDSEENSESIEKLYDVLSNLSENPINLNKTTTEELKQIPFLSDLQIMNILDYQKKQGEIVSIYEIGRASCRKRV